MRPSLTKNYFYNLAYKALTLLIPLITVPYLSRVLGAEGIGIQSYTLSIASYFVLIGCLGVSSYGSREIARERDNKENISKTFWELTFLKLIVFSIVIFFYIFLIIFSKNYSILYLILLLYLFANILDISWFFSGLEEFKTISIKNCIIKIIYTAFIFIFVRGENALIIYVALYSLFELLSAVALWFNLFKKIEKVKLKDLNIKKHFKETFIYFIPAIATTITCSIDKVMLKWITKNDAEVGCYEQAMKIVRLAESIIFSLNAIMSPRMSLLYKENKTKEIKSLLLTTFDIVFFITIPMIFGISAIANNFVPIFFGNGYELSISLMIFMSPLILITSISNSLSAEYLNPSGQRKRSSKAVIIGMFVNVVLNAILIPLMGSYGAVIASIIAEFTIVILFFIYCNNIIKVTELFKFLPKRLIAAIFMFCLVFGIGYFLPFGQNTLIDILYLFVQVVIGIVAYFSILFLTKDKLLSNSIKNLSSKIKKHK